MSEIIDFGFLKLRFLRGKHDTAGSLDMFEMTVSPEGRMPVPHYHESWEETLHGVSGIVTYTVDGRPHDIGPGAALFIPRGKVHGFDNRSGAPATCLCVLTPGVLGPEYFREFAVLVVAGPIRPRCARSCSATASSRPDGGVCRLGRGLVGAVLVRVQRGSRRTSARAPDPDPPHRWSMSTASKKISEAPSSESALGPEGGSEDDLSFPIVSSTAGRRR